MKINREKIKEILKLHEKWLNGEEGGIRADLSDTNLIYADLSYSDLSNANLIYADLSNANLSNANLSNANLIYSDLRNTDLRNANLRNANLRNADLSGTRYNENTAFFALACPEKGSFIGYKKAFSQDETSVIVEIMVTEDANRSSATTRKCRCSKAKILSITSIDGEENFDEAISNYDCNFIYKVGEIVEVTDFDEDRWNECSTGIHFFITRDEAVNY